MRVFALLAAGLLAGPLMAADDKKDAKKADEELILGKWQLEKLDDGVTVDKGSADTYPGFTMTFKKDGKVVVTGPSEWVRELEYKMDPAAKPKTLDTSKSGSTGGCIYELDGDTLKMCIYQGGADGKRPTDMKSDPGKLVMTYTRVKDEKKDK